MEPLVRGSNSATLHIGHTYSVRSALSFTGCAPVGMESVISDTSDVLDDQYFLFETHQR